VSEQEAARLLLDVALTHCRTLPLDEGLDLARRIGEALTTLGIPLAWVNEFAAENAQEARRT
jgi:hypothetical protein